MTRWTLTAMAMGLAGVVGAATLGGDAATATTPTPTSAETAATDAAGELLDRAGAFLESAGVGAAGSSAAERMDAAVSSEAGFTMIYKEMNEAQRAAADGFIDRVLTPEWAQRVKEMVAVSYLATSERPVTLRILRAKGVASGWTWSVIGRDVTMELTFSKDRVYGMGAFTLMARGGRASMLADIDRTAMQMMHRLPADLTQRAQWTDRHSGDSVTAPLDAGAPVSEMNDVQQEALRDVLELTAGIVREDVSTSVSRALAGDGWKGARVVWTGVWHPSLPHAHRIAGEGFSVGVSMTPPKDDNEARARLEWRETW